MKIHNRRSASTMTDVALGESLYAHIPRTSSLSKGTRYRIPERSRNSLFATTAGKPQQEEEDVNEVEVQRERTHDRIRARLACRQRERHRFHSLSVVGGQTRKDDDADERDRELQPVAVPEETDERCQHDTDETHEQELPEPR